MWASGPPRSRSAPGSLPPGPSALTAPALPPAGVVPCLDPASSRLSTSVDRTQLSPGALPLVDPCRCLADPDAGPLEPRYREEHPHVV
jgi:hypothetical protein